MLKLAVLVALVGIALSDRFDDDNWTSFKNAFGKDYGQEDSVRRQVFEANFAKVIRHNLFADLGLKKHRLAINKFADLTSAEFVATYNGLRPAARKTSNEVYTGHSVKSVPSTVDWRNKGIVTPVKNQAQCGSCWAFSAVASLEGQHARKTNKLVSLSEQNLVDCSQAEGNMGCGGGLMDSAFEYIKKNGGIDTEKSYPYEAVDGECRFKKGNVGATLKSYVDIASGDETALKKAAATIGPIAVGIDASHSSFQLYGGGVYDEESCSTDQLDHGVTVVGYGTENGDDYWLVKNSWGSNWGESGYIKMSRNKENQCGISTTASYPVV